MFSDLCHTASNKDRLKRKYSTAGCKDLPFKRYSSLAQSVSLPLAHLQPDAFRRASCSARLFSSGERVLQQIIGARAVVLVQHCNIRTASGVPQ